MLIENFGKSSFVCSLRDQSQRQGSMTVSSVVELRGFTKGNKVKLHCTVLIFEILIEFQGHQ